MRVALSVFGHPFFPLALVAVGVYHLGTSFAGRLSNEILRFR